ncbi:MAG TPA: hypothetical protein ENG70_04050 [Candidatus Cloacimonetes bacterium]|nr:hypothetical protein [Candidatus Cloacimonadota bacterium]HEX38015.1 hypothetical protein [Candidatus Cloacimonadota bacterium]
MKKIIRIIIVLLVFLSQAFVLLAQSDYEEWLKQEQQKIEDYKSEQDRQFMKFLEEDWEQFQVFQGLKVDDTPKPTALPKAEPQPLQTTEKEKDHFVDEIDIPEVQTKFKSPAEFLKPKPTTKEFQKVEKQVEIQDTYSQPSKSESITIKANFFEVPVELPDKSSLKVSLGGKASENSIAEYWKKISNAKYESTLEALEEYKKNLSLNDWGYCVLVYKAGKTINGGNETDARLFTWFMLNKSGYDCKVGYSGTDVYLLIPSKNSIFGAPYFTIGNDKYYVLMFDGSEPKLGSMYTYQGNYPGADKLIKLDLSTLPVLWGDEDRQVKFSYGAKTYTITYTYNKNVVDFLQTYPHTSYTVYFRTPLMDQSYASLVTQLKPILQGKTKAEALNILLRFVQTAFEYKTDQQQFGKEKALFAEETLYYPYSDCEDRSIIFAYLVHKLLDLDVIGLDYPGHIATAVKVPGVSGDYVIFNGAKYLVCDPTYINANVGMSMPRFKGVKPEVIQISS